MAYLVLVRHGQSEWNEKGLWTGWTDVDLNIRGKEEAKEAGLLLRDIRFNIAYTSILKRAHQTLEIILDTIEQPELQTIKDQALNEKNYGDYTGKNKWEVKKEVGDSEFLKIRRSWDYQIPNGESVKQVYARVLPYYTSTIEPGVEKQTNTLVVAHGNSLRMIVKYLENISDDMIANVEIATGVPYVYQIDSAGQLVSKEILGSRENTV